VAEVTISMRQTRFIRVIIDHASSENAALVVHGWPKGVRHAAIEILSADGKKVVHHQLTTHLHTDIEMPEGSQGQLFIARAAFLRHVDDLPKYGPEPTFSMPLTTKDLADVLDKQHFEEYEAHLREVERRRQEVEKMVADNHLKE
jgi:hypothetical protein